MLFVYFGHEESETGFTRDSDLSKKVRRCDGKARCLFRHTFAILHLLCSPIWITHTFSHDITDRGDDLHYPSFSLLPLQNPMILNIGGDGPKVCNLK